MYVVQLNVRSPAVDLFRCELFILFPPCCSVFLSDAKRESSRLSPETFAVMAVCVSCLRRLSSTLFRVF